MRLAAALLLLGAPAVAQQVPDSAFAPPIARPAFAAGRGPVVAIDESHRNFHTLGGRYFALAQLLQRDGYRVRAHTVPFTETSLRGVDVLVIANAVPADVTTDWTAPVAAAFAPDEIAAVRAWVADGGALLLIADHAPYGAAAARLAAAFGLSFRNGYVFLGRPGVPIPAFTRAAGTLRAHEVTDGGGIGERIDSVLTFTGQGFTAPEGAIPLLVIPPGATLYLPPAVRGDTVPVQEDAAGLLQGALLPAGQGRVAAFGEAAMFSAQLAGPQRVPAGMNSPAAPQNAAFVRAVVRWLAAARRP